MIASLRGRIIARDADSLVVEVGGLGLQVFCSARTLIDLRGETEAALFTEMIIRLRQDTLLLFGFLSEEERRAFQLLLTVPRVGPRLALAVLSALPLPQLREAIASEDTRALSVVSGVSRKLAEKIVVELREHFPAAGPERTAAALALDGEVVDALVGLGYGVIEAQRAVQEIPVDAPADIGERLRIALGRMGGQRS